MSASRWRWLLSLLMVLAACGTGNQTASNSGPTPPAQSSFQRKQTAQVGFVLYHQARPTVAAFESLQRAAAGIDGLRVVETMPDQASELTATIWQIENMAEDYPPPDADYLNSNGQSRIRNFLQEIEQIAGCAEVPMHRCLAHDLRQLQRKAA